MCGQTSFYVICTQSVFIILNWFFKKFVFSYVYVNHMHVCFLRRPEGGVTSLGTGITEDCELLLGFWLGTKARSSTRAILLNTTVFNVGSEDQT